MHVYVSVFYVFVCIYMDGDGWDSECRLGDWKIESIVNSYLLTSKHNYKVDCWHYFSIPSDFHLPELFFSPYLNFFLFFFCELINLREVYSAIKWGSIDLEQFSADKKNQWHPILQPHWFFLLFLIFCCCCCFLCIENI